MGATYTRQSSSTIVDGATIEASHFNAEFDQLVTAFEASTTGHQHDGTANEGGNVTKLLGAAITIGDGGDADIVVTFSADGSSGVLTWMEDEDHFKFSDDVVIDSSKRIYLYDEGGEYIYGDGTDLYLVSGADINIPANIGVTFGDDGEKIEGDGTDLTISGNNINLTATADVVIPANVGITFGSGEKIEGDSTDLTITSGADINLTATSDVNIPSGVGVTFGNDGEKIEGDGTDLTISGNNINLTATADVVIPANVGITFGSGEKIEGDSTDLTVTSGAKINLTATSDVVIPANVGITFGSGEKIEGDSTDLTVTSGGKINLTATSDVVIPADVGITFGSGEKIEGNNTDLTVTSGADINLTATGDVNIPTDVGITFGDDGEKIEGDGTDLTISGNNINLTATADVVIPANVGITFGSGEKIEGDSTDLTVTSGADINLTATGDVNIPTDVGITFGDDGEKIEGDGTDLTVSASALFNVDAGTDIVLDAGGGDIFFKDDGTTFGSATNTSGNLIIKSGTTTALTFSGANVTGAGTYSGGGLMTTGGNIVIPDDGNVGSASDTDAIAIASDGVVTMDQIPVFSAGINVSGGSIAGTLSTAAQGNITSVGTLTGFTSTGIDDNASAESLQIDSNGIITTVNQPTFLAYADAQANETGDGTGYTVLFANEVTDLNSDFASSTFTAPVAGTYLLGCCVRSEGNIATQLYCQLTIDTSNRHYIGHNISAVPSATTHDASMVVLADMDASDTAVVTWTTGNVTAGKATDIGGGASHGTYFYGRLMS